MNKDTAMFTSKILYKSTIVQLLLSWLLLKMRRNYRRCIPELSSGSVVAEEAKMLKRTLPVLWPANTQRKGIVCERESVCMFLLIYVCVRMYVCMNIHLRTRTYM